MSSKSACVNNAWAAQLLIPVVSKPWEVWLLDSKWDADCESPITKAHIPEAAVIAKETVWVSLCKDSATVLPAQDKMTFKGCGEFAGQVHTIAFFDPTAKPDAQNGMFAAFITGDKIHRAFNMQKLDDSICIYFDGCGIAGL